MNYIAACPNCFKEVYSEDSRPEEVVCGECGAIFEVEWICA